MTWADFWNALVEIHALPGAGLALLIIGALFRWFEPLNRFIELAASSMMIGKVQSRHPPVVMTRADAASLRAAGRAMMVVGVILFLLSVLLL